MEKSIVWTPIQVRMKSTHRLGQTGRWLVVYCSWAAAMAALSGRAAHADTGAPAPSTAIPDAACTAPHIPDRDRDHKFHRACEHYRHLHWFHRLRFGNAQLGVRTLIDSKSNALLEVTTGTFDDGSVPPGALQEVGVTITHPDRKHHDVLVFRPKTMSGYFSTPLGVLAHGEALGVGALITGIDRGIDVAAVDDTVEYRPDLAAAQIMVPATVSPGLPFSIAATVRETMGDLGATADCILSADGAVVDKATNIWVDAGGTVTCHFTATLASVGQHALHVAVANVRPGDYDMSNNGADATVNAAAQFTFSASAVDATYNGTDVTQVLDATGNSLYNENDTFSGSSQSASVNGTWGVAMTFPLASVSASATSNGATWSLMGLTNLATSSTDPTLGTCGAGSDSTGFNWVTVCSTTANGGSTNVNLSEFAGDVTYHSNGVCQQTTAFMDCSGGFTWNNANTSVYATRHPLLGSLSFNLNLADATGKTLQAFPVVPLAPYTSEYDVAENCTPQPDGTQNCFMHQYLETGVKGSVNQ
jgi:hypothetical protein